jgi:hypothetical protein
MTTAFENLIKRVKELDPSTAQQRDDSWAFTDHLDALLEDALDPTRHSSWFDVIIGEEEEEELSEDEKSQVRQIKLLWLVRKGTSAATVFHHPGATWQALSLPGKASELDIPTVLRSPLLGPILACAPECFAQLLVGKSTTIAHSLGVDPEVVKNYLEAHNLEIIHLAIWLWKQQAFIEKLADTKPTAETIATFFQDIPAAEFVARIPKDKTFTDLLASLIRSPYCQESLINQAIQANQSKPTFLGKLLQAVITTKKNQAKLIKTIRTGQDIQQTLVELVQSSTPESLFPADLELDKSGWKQRLQASSTLLSEAWLRTRIEKPKLIKCIQPNENELKNLITQALTPSDIEPLVRSVVPILSLTNPTHKSIRKLLDALSVEQIDQIAMIALQRTQGHTQAQTIEAVLRFLVANVKILSNASTVLLPIAFSSDDKIKAAQWPLILAAETCLSDLSNPRYISALVSAIQAALESKPWESTRHFILASKHIPENQRPGLYQCATLLLSFTYLPTIIARCQEIDSDMHDTLATFSQVPAAQGMYDLIKQAIETEGMIDTLAGLFAAGEPCPRDIITCIFAILKQNVALLKTARPHAKTLISLVLNLPLISPVVMKQLGGKDNLAALIEQCFIRIIPEGELDSSRTCAILTDIEDLLLHIIAKDSETSQVTEALHQLNHISLDTLQYIDIHHALFPIIPGNLQQWNQGVLAALLNQPSPAILKKTIRALQNQYVATLVQKALAIAKQHDLSPIADSISTLIATIVTAHDSKEARLRDEVIRMKFTRTAEMSAVVEPWLRTRIREDEEISRLRSILHRIVKNQRKNHTSDEDDNLLQVLRQDSTLVEKERIDAYAPKNGVWTEATRKIFLQQMKTAYYKDFDKLRANAEAQYTEIVDKRCQPSFTESNQVDAIPEHTQAIEDAIDKVLTEHRIPFDTDTAAPLMEAYDNWMMDHVHLHAVCQAILPPSLPILPDHAQFYASTQQFTTQLILQDYFGMIAPLTAMIQHNETLRQGLSQPENAGAILQLLLPFIVSSHTKRIGYLTTVETQLKPILIQIISRCAEQRYAMSLQRIFQQALPWSTQHTEKLLEHLATYHGLERKPSDSPHYELGHHIQEEVAIYNLIAFFCQHHKMQAHQNLCFTLGKSFIPPFLQKLGASADPIPQYSANAFIRRLLIYSDRVPFPNAEQAAELASLIQLVLSTSDDNSLAISRALIAQNSHDFLPALLQVNKVEETIHGLLPTKLRLIFPSKVIRSILKKLNQHIDPQLSYDTAVALLDDQPTTALQPNHLAYLKRLIVPEDMEKMLYHHSNWSQYFITKVDIKFVYERLNTHNLTNISESVFWSILLRKTIPIIMGLLLAASITSTLYFLTGLSAITLIGYGIFSALCCVPMCMIGESLYQAKIESHFYTPIIACMVIIAAAMIMAQYAATMSMSALPFIGICFLASYAIIDLYEKKKYLQAINPVIPQPSETLSNGAEKAQEPDVDTTPTAPNPNATP